MTVGGRWGDAQGRSVHGHVTQAVVSPLPPLGYPYAAQPDPSSHAAAAADADSQSRQSAKRLRLEGRDAM